MHDLVETDATGRHPLGIELHLKLAQVSTKLLDRRHAGHGNQTVVDLELGALEGLGVAGLREAGAPREVRHVERRHLVLVVEVVERRHRAPLVPLRLLVSRAVLVPNAAVTLQSMIGISWLYLLTLFFQQVHGSNPLEAGLLFAPMTLAAVVGAASAGRMISLIGLRHAVVTGVVLIGIGIVALIVGMRPAGSLTPVISGMIIGEAGFMIANAGLTVAGTAGVRSERSGLAAGLLNTSMQLGGGIGLAIVAVVVGAALSGASDQAGTRFAEALCWGMAACLVFCCGLLLLVLLGLRPSEPSPTPL